MSLFALIHLHALPWETTRTLLVNFPNPGTLLAITLIIIDVTLCSHSDYWKLGIC
jgi:hypothetical protein